MKYDTKNIKEAEEALKYLEHLIDKEHLVDVRRVSRRRSLRQNNYIHVTFGIFGLETGYTASEAKSLYKRINKDIYVYEKNGNPFVRSSADLTKDEMNRSIDVWRNYAGEQGVNIPLPYDTDALMYWENQIEQSKYI